MSSGPNTLLLMQSVQYRIFTGLLIGGVSPFSLWKTEANPKNQQPTPNASDLVRYGTNPQGTVSTAIYIGMPKNPDLTYPIQCHAVPINENVYRKTFGGRVWHERIVYVRFLYLNTTDWQENQFNLFAMADAFHVYLQQHAEMPGDAAIIASKEAGTHSGAPTGYHREGQLQGREWDCWGFMWWFREEYTVSGGFTT